MPEKKIIEAVMSTLAGDGQQHRHRHRRADAGQNTDGRTQGAAHQAPEQIHRRDRCRETRHQGIENFHIRSTPCWSGPAN
jgi:hypothetical protein